VRVVHISTHDAWGGAARAALRLHEGLLGLGVGSQMLVLHRTGATKGVTGVHGDDGPLPRLFRRIRSRACRVLEGAANKKARQVGSLFTLPWSSWQGPFARQVPEADVVNLHWVAGMMSYRPALRALSARAAVVWTLHDMNPFTGGCHYAGDCSGYERKCGACPHLRSRSAVDLSRWVWRSKARSYRRVKPGDLTVVAPSRWLAERARKSSLLAGVSVDVIPNGVDLAVFQPCDKTAARRAIGLPDEARVVMFAAHDLNDRRKGGRLLEEALGGMSHDPALRLLAVGSGDGLDVPAVPQRRLGFVEDERLLALVYAAADLFVLPTLEDNLPNTALESLGCGTPVVAFARGGVPEVVRPGETGVLVTEVEASALRTALEVTLADEGLLERLSRCAREVAMAEYGLDSQAQHYRTLYETVLENHRGE
jgi:glycosyltransferase involved in cell wall biosynthesis